MKWASWLFSRIFVIEIDIWIHNYGTWDYFFCIFWLVKHTNGVLIANPLITPLGKISDKLHTLLISKRWLIKMNLFLWEKPYFKEKKKHSEFYRINKELRFYAKYCHSDYVIKLLIQMTLINREKKRIISYYDH